VCVTYYANKSMITSRASIGVVPGKYMKRGNVEGFSRESRKRMFDALKQIDWDRAGLPLFVSLTYAQVWPEGRVVKRHLKAFWRRLRANHAGVSCMWRVELQERGAPHFHLLVWGADWISMDEVNEIWGETVGRELWCCKTGRPPITSIERVRTRNGVSWYVGKYMAKKETEEPQGGGRPVAGAAKSASDKTGPGAGPVPLCLSLPHKGTEIGLGRCWGMMSRVDLPRDKLVEIGRTRSMMVMDGIDSVVRGARPETRAKNGGWTWYLSDKPKGMEGVVQGQLRELIAAACEQAREPF
jgi:hypothetical protein